MFSHPLSTRVAPSGVPTTETAQPENRAVSPTEFAQVAPAAEYRPSADVQALLARLRELPQIRDEAVANAHARLSGGALSSDDAAELTARAIVDAGASPAPATRSAPAVD